jgi:methylphosphotriester-DNA--protein-cysteine methyltransferase
MRVYILQALLLILCLSVTTASAEIHAHVLRAQDPSYRTCKRLQPATQQRSLMRAAQKHRYTVRRVEFYGNVNTRDNILRRRILLNEGDIFTKERLIRSIERLNTVKIIKPVRLSDVEIRLDKEDKLVDMLICFAERRH